MDSVRPPAFMMVITSAVLSLHQRAEAGDLAARADLEALAELLGPAAAR